MIGQNKAYKQEDKMKTF